MTTPWRFGVEPLPQSRSLASTVRRLVGAALALEHEHPAVDALIEEMERTEERIRGLLPDDLRPRVGPAAEADRRVYLDHSRDIGDFNPCFPQYSISVQGDTASGRVNFPLAYEGPPGLVHGGFLAVFFDCAVQHHNCELGSTGKTTRLELRYLRPTPARADLDFGIHRTTSMRRIRSEASISSRGTTLCEATIEAMRSERDSLPPVSPRGAG